jgi:ElaB/YqjD/DUF883 family membrane-anchored ribosome-binding protein
VAQQSRQADTVSDRLKDMADATGEKLKETASTARDAAQKASDHAREYGEKAQETATELYAQLEKSLKDKPIQTLIGVAVVAFLAGAVWKR